jgi:hypothetical protein
MVWLTASTTGTGRAPTKSPLVFRVAVTLEELEERVTVATPRPSVAVAFTSTVALPRS